MADSKDLGQLIPPAEMAPAVPADATPEQCVAMWVDLVDATDEILLAALRSRLGPAGDVEAEYRRLYQEQMREHDRTVRHMFEELHRRLGHHGG